MAVFTFELVPDTGANIAFPTNPFYSPSYQFGYNTTTEPPTLVQIKELWNLESSYFSNSNATDLLNDFNAFRTSLFDRDNPIVGVLFKKDGVTVHELSTTTHQQFMMQSAEIKAESSAWSNYIPFSISVEGTIGVVEAGDAAQVTMLEIFESYTYNTAELLTRRKFGTVRTLAGASAMSAAQAYGLTPPNERFSSTTPGNGNVNITKVNQSDTEAEFESIIVQLGIPYPANTHEYSKGTKHSKRSPFSFPKDISVSAVGPGAESAIDNERPSVAKLVSEEILVDETGLSASGSYSVIENGKHSNYADIQYRVSVSGGGTPMIPISLTEDMFPVIHRGMRRAYIVTESITVSAYSVSGIENIKIPQSEFNREFIDEEKSTATLPYIKQHGIGRQADLWERKTKIIYVFPSPADAAEGLGQIMFNTDMRLSVVAKAFDGGYINSPID